MPRAPKFIPVAASALATTAPNLFVGTSGWAYASWKPGFYSADTPSRAFLHAYASRLSSVEVNYTFSKECTEPQLQEWLAATPPGFRFSFKAPQRITHFQRMRESEAALALFVSSLAPVRASGKLGCLLFQFPPNFKAVPERLAEFLALAPLADPSLQLAFEFRNDTWFTAAVYEILSAHNAALCIAESDKLSTPEVFTANHTYYRLRCAGGYGPAKLRKFAAKFATAAETRETFVYFKHEDEPTGALNAVTMQRTATRCAKKASA